MITSPTSHFRHANNMASSSCEPQKTTRKDKPKPCPIVKVRKKDGTKVAQSEWSGYGRWKMIDVLTGHHEEAPTELTGKWDQWKYCGWCVRGTDVGQQGTGTKEWNEAGEEDVEMGEGGEEVVGKGMKMKKEKKLKKEKEQAMEEMEGGEEEG